MKNDIITRGHKHDFIQCDRLRREYLSQTFNFMLNLRGLYEQAVKKTRYEQLQGEECGKVYQ